MFFFLKGDESAIDGPKEEIVDDGRWRPMLLTIGLLYKLHRIQETDENCWYNRPDIFLRDDDKEKDYLHIFGFYWHLCVQVAEVLKSTEIDPEAEENVRQEQLKTALQAKIENLEIETVLANVTDDNNVDDHCPDFAFLVDHPHNLIVINICGTRMFPGMYIVFVYILFLFVNSSRTGTRIPGIRSPQCRGEMGLRQVEWGFLHFLPYLRIFQSGVHLLYCKTLKNHQIHMKVIYQVLGTRSACIV